MRVRRVVKQIKVTKQSLEEIREDNNAYFAALAERIGTQGAWEAEREFLEGISKELEGVMEGDIIDVPMVEITSKMEGDLP